jgi:hypothetical protein
MNCAPRLPKNWREHVKHLRPGAPRHRLAFRNFSQRCFPADLDRTDPNVRDQIEAWWLLTQLRGDTWKYWLTAEKSEVR